MGTFVATIVAFASLWAPLPIVDVDTCPPYTQGYVFNDTIHICPDLTIPREEVVNHEIIHLIQANIGGTILPPEFLDAMVKEYLTDSEILTVLTVYANSGYTDEEFEARLLSDLPSSFIMMMYRLSEGYASTSPSID